MVRRHGEEGIPGSAEGNNGYGAGVPPTGLEARYYTAMSGEVDLDAIMAKHYGQVLAGTLTPDQARKDVLGEVIATSKTLGRLKAAIDVLGIAGGAATLGPEGGILARVAGGLIVASSISHGVGDLAQATTGLVTDPGLVQAPKRAASPRPRRCSPRTSSTPARSSPALPRAAAGPINSPPPRPPPPKTMRSSANSTGKPPKRAGRLRRERQRMVLQIREARSNRIRERGPVQ